MGRLGGLEGVGVDGLQREVANHVPDTPRLDVRLLDLGHRLTDVPRAERSLVIGELHDDDRSLRLAHRRRAVDREQQRRRFGRPGRKRRQQQDQQRKHEATHRKRMMTLGSRGLQAIVTSVRALGVLGALLVAPAALAQPVTPYVQPYVVGSSLAVASWALPSHEERRATIVSALPAPRRYRVCNASNTTAVLTSDFSPAGSISPGARAPTLPPAPSRSRSGQPARRPSGRMPSFPFLDPNAASR